MAENELSVYLRQFSLEQLGQIQIKLNQLIEAKREAKRLAVEQAARAAAAKRAEEKARKEAEEKAKLEAQHQLHQQQQAYHAPANKRVVGLPPSPPKDISALAEAADLDISGLLRDIGRRKR